MRIAVTAIEPDINSAISQRFGRAPYILVVDVEAGSLEIHDNVINLNAVQGAGIQTAQKIANLGVEAAITGHIGPNAFRALSAAGIKSYTVLDRSVSESIELFKKGKLVHNESADVEGHW